MNRASDRFCLFLCVFLLDFQIHVLSFSFFNRLDYQKFSSFAAMISTPLFVAVPTKSLGRSLSEFFSGLTNLHKLSVRMLVLRWPKTDQQPAFELLPRGYAVCMLELIVPLNCVPFKLYGSDVHLRSFWDPVETEKSREVQPVGSPSSHLGNSNLMHGYPVPCP
ncbi:hypothetical protein B296_00042500 [Ensete ventricosum]|uniref:Uncharacterized protein n=1 Tax=Ensete ventricosum TaxID=4639 RepID=A0A426ZI53_ENSVE|nr:hypothetical protein B296_00042500 [Ensete ventricosum]